MRFLFNNAILVSGMLKKLLLFLSCLAPNCLFAADTVVPGTDSTLDWSAVNLPVNGNINVGYDAPVPDDGANDIYIEGTPTTFSLTSDSDISVGDTGGGINVASGWDFSIVANTTQAINITLSGAQSLVANYGALQFGQSSNRLNSLTVVGIENNGTMNVFAQSMNAGGINNYDVMNIDLLGLLNADIITSDGGTATINADSIRTGDIQNRGGGNMNINTSGNIDVAVRTFSDPGSPDTTGAIQNVDGNIVISAGGNVSGVYMANNKGSLDITSGGLNISGGATSSFVNAGDFTGRISGDSSFANGIDLTGMASTNVFDLETYTFSLGNDIGNFWSNNLNLFRLHILRGNMTAGKIWNGANGNTSANMDLVAQSFDVTDVLNNGASVNMETTDESVDGIAGTRYINITGNVNDSLGATTNIISAGDLTIGGDVQSNGTMNINGVDISLSDVDNYGDLQILAYKDAAGSITASNNVTNHAGTMNIESRQIAITGTLRSDAGTVSLGASDSSGAEVSLGALDVRGGVMNVDALRGLSVTNTASVSSGGLNFSQNTSNVTVANGFGASGNLTVGGTTATGGGNVSAGAKNFTLTSTTGLIAIGGDIMATTAGGDYVMMLEAPSVTATNILASDSNRLAFRGEELNATGQITTTGNGGTIDLGSTVTRAESVNNTGKMTARGESITATGSGGISINGGMLFNGSDATAGLVVLDTTDLLLETTSGSIETYGGVKLGQSNTLRLYSGANIDVSGTSDISGTLDVRAENGTAEFGSINVTATGDATITAGGNAALGAISNAGRLYASSSAGNIITADVTNNGTNADMNFTGNDITMSAVVNSNGAMTLDAAGDYSLVSMSVTGGNVWVANAQIVDTSGDVTTSGTFVQGAAATYGIGINGTVPEFNALNFSADSFSAVGPSSTKYNVIDNFIVTNTVNVGADATTIIDPALYQSGDIVNAGTLEITGDRFIAENIDNSGTATFNSEDMTLGHIINSGSLAINPGANVLDIAGLDNTGTAVFAGTGLNSSGAINIAGKLTQNTAPTSGGVNVSDNYVITGPSIYIGNVSAPNMPEWSGGGIEAPSLTIYTSDLKVGGSIATGATISAAGLANPLFADISGNIAGGTDFINLGGLRVGGDYTFNDSSRLGLWIGSAGGSPNYYATVSTANDDNLGKITNVWNGITSEALIQVDGKFITDVSSPIVTGNGASISDSQIGITITDIINPGTAIWLVQADGGVTDLGIKSRELTVMFCNASGTKCYNYFDSLGAMADFPTGSGTENENDLPAYISARDVNGIGGTDSLYIVFDPRFGGPQELFKIQPKVGATPDHTPGEYWTAGALDDLIEGQLASDGFYAGVPIELVDLIFKDSIYEEMAHELYERMEQYLTDSNGKGLSRFSRLFQPREIEMLKMGMTANERVFFRDMEDRMFDEFIWNRNRQLKKVWFDADYGMLGQKSDDMKINGDRLSLSLGVDWLANREIVVGLAAKIAHIESSSRDNIDLGFKLNSHIPGFANIDVTDTNFALGGYTQITLNQEFRLYGNLFLDVHMLDISREQNFMMNTNGTGESLAINTEWGLMHDWLNQYIVGNLYVRAGYNLGFDIQETAGSDNYMNLQSDGYAMLTPGYSLQANKRFYFSPWFSMKPNISVGAEYDLFGPSTFAQFKFDPAPRYRDYEWKANPLWLNGSAGIEFKHVNGLEFGIDYRFMYNTDLMLHNFRLSASLRF